MRFFFDLVQDSVLTADDTGVEFDTAEAAKAEAARTVLEVAADLFHNPFRSLAIQLRDPSGRMIHIAELRFYARDLP
ncbi:hypothetical protein [Mesorhizobium sp.]|uniref:DUF6894 family protein n=1 Tax=Mesorhizobium sp. TaxID=1871066 RepID=UPI000FE43AC6|nr:hypothetical protein [Mesorhizobium sp.]RWH73430.1 MAG: hypothetical protein EOQ84_07405 [Mesorhizobium sp.]RWL25649.1 MAG: hypothetical protein EOR58_19625 [Mesorhizobium sp.]RWL36496.1 MAG: hypothetical protein EOR63_00680 [Mesorhizobium sp.]RWL40744.1 MAG: hypothetical protein EOR59_04605 [Mesorhizobium sp.]RWL54453.1 MAG: hypothetical protein EOR62_11890 [Mesorhizobium sp.]